MADEGTTPETGDDESTTLDLPPRVPHSDDDVNVEKLKAALRKANKEAEQHRLKLKELEDRDKSELEKLTEANRALEERARRAEIESCKARVAHKKGLTDTQIKYLYGETEEEMEANAVELLAAFRAPDPEPAPPAAGRPRERLRPGTGADGLRPGAVPDAEPDPDPAVVVAAIPRNP